MKSLNSQSITGTQQHDATSWQEHAVS